MNKCPVPYTCPLIDDAISTLERIRTANSDLREWGEELASELSDAEAELQHARDEIYDLKSEISELESQVASLNADLEAAQQSTE